MFHQNIQWSHVSCWLDHCYNHFFSLWMILYFSLFKLLWPWKVIHGWLAGPWNFEFFFYFLCNFFFYMMLNRDWAEQPPESFWQWHHWFLLTFCDVWILAEGKLWSVAVLFYYFLYLFQLILCPIFHTKPALTIKGEESRQSAMHLAGELNLLINLNWSN